jgi:hypothetical protein
MRGYHCGTADYSSVLGRYFVLTVDSSLYKTVHKIRIRGSGSVKNNIGFATKLRE